MYLKINMDKTSQIVTKDPKRVEAARKGRENYINKLKESILNDVEKGSEDISNASNEPSNATAGLTIPANVTTNPATNASKGSSDTCIYGVGILAVSTIGVCVFFKYNKKAGHVIHEQPIKPKRRHML